MANWTDLLSIILGGSSIVAEVTSITLSVWVGHWVDQVLVSTDESILAEHGVWTYMAVV